MNQTDLETLVEKYLSDLREANANNSKWKSDFETAEESIRAKAWRRIQAYESHASWQRSRRYAVHDGLVYEMTPFSWEKETPDRVRDAFDDRGGSAKLPLTLDEKAHRAERLAERHNQQSETPWRIKPEHQGEKHPLYVRPIPANGAKNRYRKCHESGKRFDYSQWKHEIPESIRPVRTAESLEHVIDDVAKKLNAGMLPPNEKHRDKIPHKYRAPLPLPKGKNPKKGVNRDSK